MRLVDKITAPLGQGERGSPDSLAGAQFTDPGSWDRQAILHEGQLQGEPPRATSKGWGDLSWLVWRR